MGKRSSFVNSANLTTMPHQQHLSALRQPQILDGY